MHQIAVGSPPECLTRLASRRILWNDFVKKHRPCYEETRDHLVANQDKRCAYCERALAQNPEDRRPHIEHWRPRSSAEKLSFDWSNLLASCRAKEHCGQFKADKKTPILDPRRHDPAAILVLRPTTGSIAVREEQICRSCHELGQNTIEVLGLNSPGLTKHRRSTFQSVAGWLPDSRECATVLKEFDFDCLISTAIWGHPGVVTPGQCPGCPR